MSTNETSPFFKTVSKRSLISPKSSPRNGTAAPAPSTVQSDSTKPKRANQKQSDTDNTTDSSMPVTECSISANQKKTLPKSKKEGFTETAENPFHDQASGHESSSGNPFDESNEEIKLQSINPFGDSKDDSTPSVSPEIHSPPKSRPLEDKRARIDEV